MKYLEISCAHKNTLFTQQLSINKSSVLMAWIKMCLSQKRSFGKGEVVPNGDNSTHMLTGREYQNSRSLMRVGAQP